MSQTYYIYILRCQDGSLYTGITVDMLRRIAEHLAGGHKAAKYTRMHRPIALEAVWQTQGKAAASWLEWRIKKLSRMHKEKLLCAPQQVCDLAQAAQKMEWTFEVVSAQERERLWKEKDGKKSISHAPCSDGV
ncbi:GIY-YIG nuclease family protein [Atopobium fossor]|uniref:GIY-YIG nuclease family protein n=1 Tax=Atopobium fossor TaxID=39487 RepID=UPI000485905E|nr:GIY-YIG nuclease family protein [Atopobium fossor]